MSIAHLITGHAKDLGGFTVKRLLPAVKARSVGPFIFFDHMGPAEFPPGNGIDVRPHPHIGLATVTYLFEGEILHRDSLGYVQAIQPGAVNWMTAGRGIVHSERTAPEIRARGHRLHGIQTWVALPVADEEIEPSFHHHPAGSLPAFEIDGVRLRLILGEALGRCAPVKVFSPIFYFDVALPAGARFVLPPEYTERGLYVVDGSLRIAGQTLSEGDFAVFAPGVDVQIDADLDARAMILGGARLEAARHMVWNFVSSRAERIEQAKRDWAAQTMGQVPGETEFIPYP
jgi:redox-sensitive bicupin YhaK (pirin superfamily)